MTDFFKKRWPLFLVLILFIIGKIPHLSYPFYWDEAMPYAAAVKAMYRHGLSLMPNAIVTDLSRGHPLLFHVLAALWMHVFGPSNVSLHTFALLIAVLVLVFVYEAGLRLFDQRVAVISLVLIAIQVIFFVQSSFLLPEVLIAGLSFACIYCHVTEKHGLTMLSLTALFFIKESGLVTGLLLGVSALIGLFNKNKGWKDRIYPLVSVLVPCVLIGIFFLVQKHVNGWYFFPYHYSLITLEWAPFWYSFKATQAGLLFTTCYRHFYFFLLLALSLLAAVKNKNLKYLVIFIPAILVYFLADNKRAQIVERMISSIPLFILFLLAVTSFLYALISLKIFKDARQQKMAILIVLFILYFNCFSAINFFTLRYILSVLVPLLFFLAILFNALIECTYPILFYPLLILIISLGGHAFYADTGIGDCNPGAFDAIDVEQHMAGFMEKNNYYTRPVTTAFLNMTYLTEPDCGYLSPGKIFSNVRPDLNDATDLAIFDNISCDESVAVVRKDTTYQLAYRYEKGHAWIEVYARKR